MAWKALILVGPGLAKRVRSQDPERRDRRCPAALLRLLEGRDHDDSDAWCWDFSPPEIYITAIAIRNANVEADVTIERIVIRDMLGNQLWESAPGSHPENTDYPAGSPARDITTVPAGQGRYIRTVHFYWGLNPVPGPAGVGNLMTIELDLSTTGKRDLVVVGASRSVRERQGAGISTSPFFEAAERTRDSSTCIRVD